MFRSPFFKFAIFLGLAVLLAALAPLERTLGANARLVYLHGAWVWAAMAAFLAAGAAGLAGFLPGREGLHEWSRALGRSGLCLWLTFLPMSLYVMQANWNAIYLDEPRFRTPLNLAIVGLLLQVGLSFLPEVKWTSLANAAFAGALVVSMNSVQAVLHPDAPIFNSEARGIQLFFVGLLALILAAAWELAGIWMQWQMRSGKAGR